MAFGIQAGAQTWQADSVKMGAGYADDVFYDLHSGNDKTAASDNWDLAFQINKFGDPMFNGSVRANHIKRDVQVYLLNKKGSTGFGTLVPADTNVSLSSSLVNNDTSWGTGAFTVCRGSNQFDFGWGSYNMTTHNLSGDTLFLVKAKGVFYQMWIQEYVSTNNIEYRFKVAKWDGTGVRNDTVKRVAPYDDRLFAYYDLETGTVIDREPSRKDWDLNFVQYQKGGQPGGQNPKVYQAYAGVLTNLRTEVAKITGVDPNTINTGNYTSHTGNLSKETNIVGDDWKSFNMSTFMYDIDANTSYIIKPDTAYNGEAYIHLRFTRFDGGSGGAEGWVVFEKRVLYALSVENTQGVEQAKYSIYPNPAQNQVNVMVDAKAADNNTVMVLSDVTGKVLQSTTVQLKKGVNAYSFNVAQYPTGTYIMSVMNSDFKVTQKVVVQH